MPTVANPFTPAFGASPHILAGRAEILSHMRRACVAGYGDPNLSTLLIGARGTGKTALMAAIRAVAEEEGWITTASTALPGLLEDIEEQAYAAANHLIPDTEPKLTSLSVGPVAASWKQNRREGNWRTRMNHLLDTLAQHETGFLITVDEVHSDLEELVQLAAIYQHFVTEGRKVALVMAGLPFHVDSLVSDRTVSFLRRSTQHRLGRIDSTDVSEALSRTITDAGRSINPDALELCTVATDGFPYMLQLVGFRTWNVGHEVEISLSDAEMGIRAARRDMEDRILGATYRELSDKDIAFLEAMVPDRDVSQMAKIAERMGVSTGYAAQYRKRLLAAGAIRDVARGRIAYDLPGLREYIAEQASIDKEL